MCRIQSNMAMRIEMGAYASVSYTAEAISLSFSFPVQFIVSWLSVQIFLKSEMSGIVCLLSDFQISMLNRRNEAASEAWTKETTHR